MYINIVQYKVYCTLYVYSIKCTVQYAIRSGKMARLRVTYSTEYTDKKPNAFFVIQIICHYLRKYNTNTYCTYGKNLLLYSIPVHVLQYDILSYVFSIYSILVLYLHSTLYRRSGSDHWQAETVNI